MIQRDDKKLVAVRLRGLLDLFLQRDDNDTDSDDDDEGSAADFLGAAGISLSDPSE